MDDVKALLAPICDIDVKDQILICDGLNLELGSTLGEYNLPTSGVCVSVRLCADMAFGVQQEAEKPVYLFSRTLLELNASPPAAVVYHVPEHERRCYSPVTSER